eukprot:TRINITY_DN30395_c0_g1_i1.p1 TRINITY_DN30395_c0_g1~~TRINITY_DN30395_c0_g1_i1.p1  ORF type:complete len:301 (+),score=34.41 TRINITY_DN30395_c0_g1_i1:61-903(+)
MARPASCGAVRACVFGLGGPRSADYPFRRAHLGRAFVEHIADVSDGFSAWRPVSGALADLCENSSGIIFCRLWAPVDGDAATTASAAQRCVRYLGIQTPGNVAVAYGQPWRSPGQFAVTEGPSIHSEPPWAKGVAEAIAAAKQSPVVDATSNRRHTRSANSAPLRLQIHAGWPQSRQIHGRGLDAGLKQYADSRMSPEEAATVLEAVFPAAYEWLQKRWLGGSAITEGTVFKKVLPHELRRSTRPQSKGRGGVHDGIDLFPMSTLENRSPKFSKQRQTAR